MTVKTKIDLNSQKIKQGTTDTLSLSGVTTLCTGGICGVGNSYINSNSGYQISGLTAMKLPNSISAANIGIGYRTMTGTTGLCNISLGHEALAMNTTGCQNIAIGYRALQNNTTGCGNIAEGYLALLNNVTGFHNFAIGGESLKLNSCGGGNIAIGCCALVCNISGCSNIALGLYSLVCNTADNNIGIGRATLYRNCTGTDNVGIGYYALCGNVGGSYNLAIGNSALSSNNNGIQNIAIGYQTLCDNTASNNVGLGPQVLAKNTGGASNVGIGLTVLGRNLTGCYNIGIGCQVLYYNSTGCNNIGIGAGALCCNGTGCNNIGSGFNVLAKNTSGCNNVANGYIASCCNTTGCNNISNGFCALTKNSTGSNNIANGFTALYNNTASNNIAMGYQALSANTSGANNIALGYQTLVRNTGGNYNIALGCTTLQNNTTGSDNVGLGFDALDYNVCGLSNFAASNQALRRNTCGCYNTAIGFQALYYNGSGNNNIGIGSYASYCNVTGNNNIANGYLALYNNCASNNIALGYRSLSGNTTGANNISMGCLTMPFNTTGNNNIAIGTYALSGNSSGCNNIAIGCYAGYNETGSNKLYISNVCTTTPLVYGDFSSKCLRINGELEISGVTTGSATNDMLAWDSSTKAVKKVPNYSGLTVPYSTVNYSKDYTGFINGSNIDISYNYTNRTITLTGDLSYLWRGVYRTLTSPWTSTGHTTTLGTWYLSTSDGTNFIWKQTPWNFYDMMVAFVNYKSTSLNTFAVRETHELMDWYSHKESHDAIGTYLKSGGQVTALSYTANTATDNAVKPSFNAAYIDDEDLTTTISAWNKLSGYTTMYVSGTTSVFSTTSTHPFIAGGTNQYIQVNNPTTGAMSVGINARWYNVYQILIPTTTDSNSQKYRMVMLQPQATFTSLAAAQAEDTKGLSWGSLTSESAEFLIYSRITYASASANNNYGKVTIPTGGISYVVGTKMSQISVAGISATNHANLSNLNWADSGHIGTANSFAAFNSSGIATEILTSSIELATMNTQTGTTYTLQASDLGKTIELTNTGSTSIILPTGLTIGFQATIVNVGGGNKTLSGGTGSVVYSKDSKVIIAGAYNAASVYYRATNKWVGIGNLS